MGSCPKSLERFSVHVHERCDTSNTCYLLPVSVKKKTKTFRIALLRGRPPSPPNPKLNSIAACGFTGCVFFFTGRCAPTRCDINFEFGGDGGAHETRCKVLVSFFSQTPVVSNMCLTCHIAHGHRPKNVLVIWDMTP